MNVVGDRTVEHGLATIGFDDEGVAGQQFDIIRDGVLVGYQLNRQMAQANGLGATTAARRAPTVRVRRLAGYTPLQRMPNVSLRRAPGARRPMS